MSGSQPKKEAIVIGVDFGTTFSGVAWCYTGDPSNIRTIKRWKGNNKNLEKVPSIIQYSTNNTSRFKWGFEVTADAQNQLRWFKLLLNEQAPSHSRLPIRPQNRLARNYTGDEKQLAQLRHTLDSLPSNKTPVSVTSDYLGGLYKHTLETLRGAYPESFTKEFGKEIPLEFWLTVPAIWSDTAKDLTLQAAKEAGFDESQMKIKIVTEPEAAAVHCFKTFKGSKDSLKVGDVYVIADCGGGTVDLITYRIASVEPRLRVDECVGGTGGLCGSTALNRRFEELVIDRLGRVQWNNMTTVARNNTLLHFDEFLKPTFCPPEYSDEEDDEFETETYHCPVPGVLQDLHRRIRGGHLLLSSEEMKGIFEPTLEEILGLVQKQISQAESQSGSLVTGVLLVGGFGTSQYLYKYLSAKLRSKDGTQVKVLKPDDAWSAIAQGAVSHGLAARQEREGLVPAGSRLVGSRIARFSYGTSASEPFIAGLHPAHKMYFDPLEGCLHCSGRTQWFVKKGDRLYDGKAEEIHLYRKCPTGAGPERLIFPEEILVCDQDEPPEDVEDPAVRHLLTFTADMNGVPRKRHFIRKRAASGSGAYWYIPLIMCMLYESGEGLEFSTKVGGASVGKGSVQYNHKLPEKGTILEDQDWN